MIFCFRIVALAVACAVPLISTAQQVITIAPSSGVAPAEIYSGVNHSGVHTNTFTLNSSGGTDQIDLQVTNLPIGVTVYLSPASITPGGAGSANFSVFMGIAVTNVTAGDYTLTIVASSPTASFTTKTRTFGLHVGHKDFWVATNPASTNWSTAANWSPALIPGDDVGFEDQAFETAGTNKVTVNTTIGRLTYLRAKYNTVWQTILNSGVTLMVTNGFSANSFAPDNGGGTGHNFGLTVTGSGGASLIVSNFSKNFSLNQANSAAASTTYKFNFSGLPNLRAYVNRFGILDLTMITEGTVAAQNSQCDLAANTVVVASYVGDYTREHFTNAISIWNHDDNSAYQNGQPFTATLGASSTFWADSFVLGGGRLQSAANTLSARAGGSTAQFRNADGVSRMMLFGIAVDSGVNTIGSGSRATFNFSSGNLNVLADQLWLGRCRPRQGPAANAHIHGTLLFGNGSVVDVNTAILGYQAFTNDNDCRGVITNNNGTFIVNQELVLGYTSGDFITNGSFANAGFGSLNISGANGRARINKISVGGPANVSTGNAITIWNNGGLILTNTAGDAAAKINRLALTNASLTLHLDGAESPRIYVQTLTTGTGNSINFAAITNTGAYPVSIPLIDYDTMSGPDFSLGTFPSATPGFAGSLSNDTAAGIIYLVLTSGPTQPGPVTWTGAVSDDWDTTSSNWLNGETPYTFADGVPARFDDSGLSGNINLTADRAPSRTIVSNDAVAYTFTGSGKLTGVGGLIKQGSGALFVANGNNDFAGGTLISGGTLQIGLSDASGSLGGGNVTNDATLIFNRSDDLAISNSISGTGTLTQNGSGKLTLSADNNYTGDTIIAAGALALSGNSAISASGNITIAAVAAFDVSGRADGTLNLANGQTLRGNGTIRGRLIAANGSEVSPGLSVGLLTVTNNIVLQGTTTMEVNKLGGTNDVLRSSVNIAFDGTLIVSNLNNALSEGDRLKLFDAPNYSGSFGSVIPSAPGTGLAWDTTSLITNGVLRVVSDTPPGTLNWTGAVNTNWDTTTANWLASGGPTIYADGLPVQFGDSGLQTNVNLTTTLSPSLTIVNNSSVAYTFTGVGRLSGNGGLVKLGASKFTIANGANNDFSGGITIAGGTLQVGNGSTAGNLGSGKLTNNAALIFNHSDNLTVSNNISGAGSLTQNGNGKTSLAGNETYTGDTTVNAGRMALIGSSGISSSAIITVAGGAALDVTGRTDGTLTLASGQTVRGSGSVLGNLTANFNAIVSPGQSVGILTVTNAVVLRGTVVMEIDKTSGTNDLLGGASSLDYGGTLVISNLSAALADGDSFKLFDANGYSGGFTNIIPKRPGTGLAWDTSDLTDSGTLRVTLAPPVAPSASLKIDLSISGRASAIDPNFTSWPIPGGNVVSSNFSGVTITFTKVGAFGTGLKGDWWKAGVEDFGARMANDGITVDNGNLGGQIEMRVSGLSRGPHTIATYHNTWGDPASHTYSPMNIYINGVLTFPNFVPSNRVTNNYDAASAFMQVEADDDEDIVILYESVTNNAATDKNVWIDGIEIDTVDSTTKALNPFPENRDEHVDADATRSVLMTWFAAASAVSQDVYFGDSSNAVATATHASPEFKGNQAGTNYLVTNLSTLATYYWRVDEVNATNGVAKGDLWYFRTRHMAFPGAEGYGRFARGGRSGIVLEVTNLADSGPGTFREAINTTLADNGPRTIVFAVSGLITLESPLTVSKENSKLTIAGQTAPGKGINLRKYSFGFSGGEDVIVRHMRVYPGKYSGTTLNGMGFGGVDNSIMDHCSSGWSLDECIPSRGAKNMTIQHVMIAEPLNQAGHKNYPPGTRHGYSSSTSGDIGSWHHDLLAHAEGRNWSLAGGLDGNGKYAGRLDIRCNVVYNWNGRTTDGGVAELNFVNNYYKKGPVGGINTYLNPDHGTNSDGSYGQRYYSFGNVMPGFPQSNSGGWMTNQPFFPSYVTTENPTNAYKIVLSDVGCTQPVLDDHDSRVIQETITGTYTYSGSASGLHGLPDDENDVGAWENYPEIHRDANWDTDHDGLPNWWETMRGLNPNSTPGDFSDSQADLDGDEYTELDRYLNWMGAIHFDCTNTVTRDVDLSQFTRGFTASPVHAVFAATNGTVMLLGDGKTARFTPTASFSGLAAFKFSVTDSAGDTMTNAIGIHVIAPGGANTAPILSAISNRVVNVGVNVVITNNATDSDVPAQTLTFSLMTAITNATINSANGVFAWRPLVSQAKTTNAFSIIVTDNGSPNLSATQNFSVVVNPLTLPINSLLASGGGGLSLSVNGQVGPDYAVQNSTNLTDWNTLLTTNPPVMPFTWTVLNTTNLPMQFFRIKVGPPLP